MMEWRIGRVSNKKCCIAEDAPNKSIVITGCSGSGKTVRSQMIAVELAMQGRCVVVIDSRGTYSPNRLFDQINNEKRALFRWNNVKSEGVGFSLLNEVGEDALDEMVDSCSEILEANTRFGARQKRVLKEVIRSAVEGRAEVDSDAEAFAVAFDSLADYDSVVEIVLEKTKQLVRILRGNVEVTPGSILVYDLTRFAPKTALQVSEFLLRYFWQMAYSGDAERRGGITIVVDEVQNFDLRSGILPAVMTEGRKYSLDAIVCTQSLSRFKPAEIVVLKQAGTHLFFRPSDAEVYVCAKWISAVNPKSWHEKLTKLNVGEAISTGSFMVGKASIKRPLLTVEI